MIYSIEYLPEVEKDVLDIHDWYEEQYSGLGDDFLLSVDAALNAVERNPLLFQVLFKGIRKTNTRRFPFGIFFIVDSNVITVLAIIHLSRHPRTWKKRLSRFRSK